MFTWLSLELIDTPDHSEDHQIQCENENDILGYEMDVEACYYELSVCIDNSKIIIYELLKYCKNRK